VNEGLAVVAFDEVAQPATNPLAASAVVACRNCRREIAFAIRVSSRFVRGISAPV
jgi:hypothetical protein